MSKQKSHSKEIQFIIMLVDGQVDLEIPCASKIVENQIEKIIINNIVSSKK